MSLGFIDLNSYTALIVSCDNGNWRHWGNAWIKPWKIEKLIIISLGRTQNIIKSKFAINRELGIYIERV